MIINYIKSFIAVLFIVFMGSCKKVSVENELEDTYVQFNYPNSYPSDGYAYTQYYYFPTNKDVDTVQLELKTLGLVPEKDYEVKLEQIKEAQLPTGSEQAVVGLHYVDFNDVELKKRYILPAGSTTGKVPLVVKRDIAMRGKTVQLSIQVAESADTKPGVIAYKRYKILLGSM